MISLVLHSKRWKTFYKMVDLNDELLTTHFVSSENSDALFSNVQESRTTDQETEKGTLIVEMRTPNMVRKNRPVAGERSYVHAIRIIERKYPECTTTEEILLDKLLEDYATYGIITARRLPQLCDFPVFTDLGEIKVRIDCNADTVVLNAGELEAISVFHRCLFLDILRIVPKCFAYNKKDKDGYFIAPLYTLELAWSVIEHKIKINNPIKPVAEEDRRNKRYAGSEYVGKVVVPWYVKHVPPKYYIVTKYEMGMNVKSEFPNPKYKSFKEYFELVHKMYTINLQQRLLEVSPITRDYNCVRPRPVTSFEKLRKRNEQDVSQYLVPEFCHRETFPAVFWYKSTILPSILHRFHQLLLAEELRYIISTEAGIGPRDQLIDQNDVLAFSPSKDHATIAIMEQRKVESSKSKTMLEKPTFRSITQKNVSSGEMYEQIEFTEEPSLLVLKEHWVQLTKSPRQHELLEALTPLSANDIVNYERLETLGDSFLKYSISLVLYIKFPEKNEGQLTRLKSEIISNQHLFDCGNKHDLGSFISQMFPFDAAKTWYPAGFSIPKVLSENIEDIMSSCALLYVDIPRPEQFSGVIGQDTIAKINENIVTRDAETQLKFTKNDEDSKLFYLKKQRLPYKIISDVVEALLGAYVLKSGTKSAFKLLKYFGILADSDMDELLDRKLPSPRLGEFSVLVMHNEKLEKLFDYKFNDRSYIVQALSHPSLVSKSLSDYYQKLEFVGDALLDFLITSYIYEYCGNLSPGKITDLRSALVNNNVFGALTVRLNLHEYLLMGECQLLDDAINNFVEYQKSKNYQIHGNEFMKLIKDGNTNIAEEVDIPKTLGDIFESFAGAILLDSGYNMKIVWRIYYNIMREEIYKFSENIPINPVRALYERNPNIRFEKITEEQDITEMQLSVPIKNGMKLYHSRGPNGYVCKRAAAKIALKDLGYNEFVI